MMAFHNHRYLVSRKEPQDILFFSGIPSFSSSLCVRHMQILRRDGLSYFSATRRELRRCASIVKGYMEEFFPSKKTIEVICFFHFADERCIVERN